MPGPFRPVYLDVKGEQSLEQLGLAIKMMLAERAPWNCFAAVNIAGSGMVQSQSELLWGLPFIGADRQ